MGSIGNGQGTACNKINSKLWNRKSREREIRRAANKREAPGSHFIETLKIFHSIFIKIRGGGFVKVRSRPVVLKPCFRITWSTSPEEFVEMLSL